MPNEVLYILFIAMVIATGLNLMGFIRSRKREKEIHELIKTYHHLIFEAGNRFFKHLGAYEAPENGQLYLDLPGGLRLVIYEGKVEGWYMLSGPENPEERRAEVFERMAFEASEERDAALWMIRNGADACIYCANRNECSVDEEPDCLCCLDGSCPCKECISGGSNFALDKKRVQEEMAKEAEE